MSLGNKKGSKLAATKQSQKIQDDLRTYQRYWRKSKGQGSPSVIRVNQDQLKKLGVESGFYFEGSKLELAK